MTLSEMLRMNLQMFAADTGADGGADDPASDNTGSEENPGTGSPEPKPEDTKTFTQDDVNSIAAKESKKAQEKVFKELGIEDFDSAKEGFQKFKEWQESQKTEQEKQTEKLEELQTTTAELTEENSSLKLQLESLKAGVPADKLSRFIKLAGTSDAEDWESKVQETLKDFPEFAAVKEEEEEQKPRFSKPGNPNGAPKDTDPFQAITQKYKR